MENIEVITQYEGNGQYLVERSYLNGVSHGPQKKYFENGNLRYFYHTKNGLDYGVEQQWFIGGKRNFIMTWRNGQVHSPRIRFCYGK